MKSIDNSIEIRGVPREKFEETFWYVPLTRAKILMGIYKLLRNTAIAILQAKGFDKMDKSREHVPHNTHTLGHIAVWYPVVSSKYMDMCPFHPGPSVAILPHCIATSYLSVSVSLMCFEVFQKKGCANYSSRSNTGSCHESKDTPRSDACRKSWGESTAYAT